MPKRVSDSSKLLHVIIAIELPNSRSSRQLVKVQVSSLLRYFFNGDIAIWRNFFDPVYSVNRSGVFEFEFTTKSAIREDADLADIIQEEKLQIAKSLVGQTSEYSWVIISDADTLALRNWDHLFDESDVDLLVSRDRNGNMDDGFFAVRSTSFCCFLDLWSSSKSTNRSRNFNYLETNPLSPPSDPVQRRLQSPPAKSNFLAVTFRFQR